MGNQHEVKDRVESKGGSAAFALDFGFLKLNDVQK